MSNVVREGRQEMDLAGKVPPPLQAIFHQQAKSIIAIRELQHEVSSLLEFKNALLETFPHLHQKINGIPGLHTQAPNDVRAAVRGTPLANNNPGDISDDIPSSWNVNTHPNTGSMPRLRKLRKSPEGSSTGSTVADSGFSTGKDETSGTSTLLSPGMGPGHKSTAGPPLYPNGMATPDVRWDTWMMSSTPSSPPPGLAGPTTTGQQVGSSPSEDELMCLLDVIHRKAVKLRAQQLVEQDWGEEKAGRGTLLTREESRKYSDKTRPMLTLGAISEVDGGSSDSEPTRGVSEEIKERVRRKLLVPDEGINRQDRELLVDRISELESETLRSHTKVTKLETEIARISRQKELLEDQLRTAVNIKSELDSKIHDMHSQYVKGGGGTGSLKKEGPGGIIHSVQILTGGTHTSNSSLHSSEFQARGTSNGNKQLSQSETNLRRAGGGGDSGLSGSINIEIRQPGVSHPESTLSKSSEHLMYGIRGHSSSPLDPRFRSQGGAAGKLPMSHSVSVVNLRAAGNEQQQANLDNVQARQRVGSFGTPTGAPLRPVNPTSRFFQNRISAPPPPGTKVSPQLDRVLSNEKLSPKSRSVENLYEQRMGSIIKSAHSEISLQPRTNPHPYLERTSGLKTTQSEQVLTKIGRLEKVKLEPAISHAMLSMPAELVQAGGNLRIRPNRERIRQILATSNVLELQRQLLTTVMENEVYKSQVSRLSEGWQGKAQDFERVNSGLQASLKQLMDDNEQIRMQVEEKSIELEGTRARLRQLERSSERRQSSSQSSSKLVQTDFPDYKNGGAGLDLVGRLGTDNYVKFGPAMGVATSAESPRVTFDLGPKKAKVLEGTSVKKPSVVETSARERKPTQLPSDAKQRLQEMAAGGGVENIRRNFRKSSTETPPPQISAPRPNRLHLTQAGSQQKQPVSPPSSPAKHQPSPTPAPLTPEHINFKQQTPQQHPVDKPKSSLTRRDSRSSNSAKNTIMNLQNNNITRAKLSGRESLPRTGTSSNGHLGPRTRTPSTERSISSLKQDSVRDGADARDPSKDQMENSKLRDPETNSSQVDIGGGSRVMIGAGGGGHRLLPAPPHLPGEPGTQLSSMELKQMGRETIAGLIAGILQKYTKKQEGGQRQSQTSFVEIALHAEEDEGDGKVECEAKEANEEGSRPVTVLSRLSGGSPTGSRVKREEWEEKYAHIEEETHESHIAHLQTTKEDQSGTGSESVSGAQECSSATNYFKLPQEEAPMVVRQTYGSQDSLTLPDSLNEFEGEEYQTPNIYHDSLGGEAPSQREMKGLGGPEDVDSLQFAVSPTPVKDVSNSPVDSLIAIKQSNKAAKMTAAEFFDSITSLEKPAKDTRGTKKRMDGDQQKRRIIPYCDNSLSSGTSAFTSQDDVSFDSKDSSPPSDNDRTRQGLVSNNKHHPTNVTLDIHPLTRSPPSPPNSSIHPLSRRYQPSLSTNTLVPTPSSEHLRIEDIAGITYSYPQSELVSPPHITHQLNANHVVVTSDVQESNQTKELSSSPGQPQQPAVATKTNMSLAKSATEKLKWKFLGW